MSVRIIRYCPWDTMGFRSDVQTMNFLGQEKGMIHWRQSRIYSTHSELNAILNYNGGSLSGAKLYVSLFPCSERAKAIIQSGIKEVIYDCDKYADTPGVLASKRMMDAARRCGTTNTIGPTAR